MLRDRNNDHITIAADIYLTLRFSRWWPLSPVTQGLLQMALFVGQNTVEFGSANYSANAFLPVSPYTTGSAGGRRIP